VTAWQAVEIHAFLMSWDIPYSDDRTAVSAREELAVCCRAPFLPLGRRSIAWGRRSVRKGSRCRSCASPAAGSSGSGSRAGAGWSWRRSGEGRSRSPRETPTTPARCWFLIAGSLRSVVLRRNTARNPPVDVLGTHPRVSSRNPRSPRPETEGRPAASSGSRNGPTPLPRGWYREVHGAADLADDFDADALAAPRLWFKQPTIRPLLYSRRPNTVT
jgi:hypothetical protein